MLRRLLGGRSSTSPIDGARRIDLSNGEKFYTALVGESFYQDTLRKLCPRHDPVIADVVLVPEPDNKHDPNCVAVWTERGQIGHLSREDAAKHQDALLRLFGAEEAYAACKARLIDAGAGTSVGARIDLDISALHKRWPRTQQL